MGKVRVSCHQGTLQAGLGGGFLLPQVSLAGAPRREGTLWCQTWGARSRASRVGILGRGWGHPWLLRLGSSWPGIDDRGQGRGSAPCSAQEAPWSPGRGLQLRGQALGKEEQRFHPLLLPFGGRVPRSLCVEGSILGRCSWEVAGPLRGGAWAESVAGRGLGGPALSGASHPRCPASGSRSPACGQNL